MGGRLRRQRLAIHSVTLASDWPPQATLSSAAIERWTEERSQSVPVCPVLVSRNPSWRFTVTEDKPIII